MKISSKLQSNDNGTVTITGEVAWADVEGFRADALKELGEKVEVDGFRKGHIPEDVLIKKVTPMGVVQEMAHHALMHAYPEVVQEHKVDAIGRPDIAITKIAENSPLGFSITTAVMPTITIKKYKKIAQKIVDKADTPEVSDEEVQSSLLQIRKMRKQSELAKDAEDPQNVPSINDIDEQDLPELDDEYVATLGEFENVEDFTTKLRANLVAEKESREHEKTRVAIVDALVEEDTAVMPDMLVQFEIDKMMVQMEHDMSMAGMAFDDYLAHTKKTREELRQDMHADAAKRAHMQMILNHIATEEKLEPDAEKVATEMENIKKMYAEHKDYDEARARDYVESMLLNQAVFEFLEK